MRVMPRAHEQRMNAAWIGRVAATSLGGVDAGNKLPSRNLADTLCVSAVCSLEAAMSDMTSRRSRRRGLTDRFMYGLLVVQIIVGFEYFWSVMVKIVRGGFTSGLAADLEQRVTAAPGWYASFARDLVIPNASAFGYLIIAGELFVGVTFIATAIVWMTSWDRLGFRGRLALSGLALLAGLAALAMNLNYHIASGAPNPWQLSSNPFEEGVDIDMLLVMINATLSVVMGSVVASLIGRRRKAEPAVDTSDLQQTEIPQRLAA
jgi:hypothetical protein